MYDPRAARAVKHPRVLQEPGANAANAVRGAEASPAPLEHPRGKAERTAAWAERLVPTLRLLQQLRSRERDLRVLPLPPPPLPDAESSARPPDARACVGVSALSARERGALPPVCARALACSDPGTVTRVVPDLQQLSWEG